MALLLDVSRAEELLQWLTGSNQIPALGFEVTPSIHFGQASALDVDDATASYPVADTCGLRLRLPIVPSYNSFRDKFMEALTVTTFTAN